MCVGGRGWEKIGVQEQERPLSHSGGKWEGSVLFGSAPGERVVGERKADPRGLRRKCVCPARLGEGRSCGKSGKLCVRKPGGASGKAGYQTLRGGGGL